MTLRQSYKGTTFLVDKAQAEDRQAARFQPQKRAFSPTQQLRFEQFYKVIAQTYQGEIPKLKRVLSQLEQHSARLDPTSAHYQAVDELRLVMQVCAEQNCNQERAWQQYRSFFEC